MVNTTKKRKLGKRDKKPRNLQKNQRVSINKPCVDQNDDSDQDDVDKCNVLYFCILCFEQNLLCKTNSIFL